MNACKKILDHAGFVENETYKETRFLKPPKVTYAVFMSAYNRRGADYHNLITDYENTIELYAYKPDPTAETNIETAFDYYGIEYEKQERYWIEEENLYQTIYTFNLTEK